MFYRSRYLNRRISKFQMTASARHFSGTLTLSRRYILVRAKYQCYCKLLKLFASTLGTLNYAPYIIPSDWLRANLKGTVKFPYRHPGISTAPAQLEIAHDEQTVFRVSDNGIGND